MRRAPGPVAIRPLNLGEVLDGAFKLFIANWRTIVVVAGIFVVPLQLLSAYLQRDLLGGGLLEMMTDPASAEMFMGPGGSGEDLAFLLAFLQGLLVTPLLTGAVAAVAAASYFGGTVQPREALSAGVRRWWALIISWVLLILAAMSSLAVAGGLITFAAARGLPMPVVVLAGLLLVLAGVAASLAIASLFAAAPAAIVVERLGPLRGLRRSARLLRPRLLPTVGTVVVTTLLVSVLSGALGGIPQLAGMMVGQWGWVLVAVGAILAGLVTTPLLAIVLTLLYFDGRVRHEALDLRLAAEGLSGGHAEEWDAPGGLTGR